MPSNKLSLVKVPSNRLSLVRLYSEFSIFARGSWLRFKFSVSYRNYIRVFEVLWTSGFEFESLVDRFPIEEEKIVLWGGCDAVANGT